MAKLVYLGHASFLLKGEEYSLVIDPYRNDSVPNMKFPQIEEVDAVFCSHDHYDHDARDLVRIKKNTQVVKPLSICVPHDNVGGAKRGMNEIRLFDIEGYKVVHLGDTGCVPNEKILEPLKNCDILLAPINGFFTIGPKELEEIVKIVKPRILIPMHYYMSQYQSGYPDGNMIDEFKKRFPNIKYLESVEIDLNDYKDYQGVLIFNRYLQ